MQYRTMTQEQHELFARHDAEAFGESLAELRTWLESDHEVQLRGLFDGDEPVAQLCFYRLDILDGRGSLPCVAIGAVSCRPTQRRRGYVGMLLRQLCEEMLQSGIPLSALYPFKMSFYRQFGWARAIEQRLVQAKPESFAAFRKPGPGHFELIGPEQSTVLHDVYLSALHGRFGPVARSPHRWQHIMHERYAYVWRDDAGQARAYCIYAVKQRDAKQTMLCREAVALDAQARAQLFGFMGNMDSLVERVEFHAPAEAPLSALLGNDVEFQVKPGMMLRLLDCKAALERYHFPKSCAGRLTLAISDSWLPDNQGVYALELYEGQATITRLPPHSEADIACDVAVLAQLYSRLVRPRIAATFGLIDVHNRSALKLLEAMFDGLAPFTSDYF